MLYTGTLPETFTEILKKVMTEENHTGWIKNGASVEYKPTMTTEKRRSGDGRKEILTDEEATFKTGLFTWNANSLAKLSATAVVTTEDGENGKKYRRLKVGGTANDDGKQYVILFVHEDPVEGNCYLLIVGRNTAGFTITFAADSATVIDAEFNCKPHDSRGTLIEFVEEYEEEYQNEYTKRGIERADRRSDQDHCSSERLHDHKDNKKPKSSQNFWQHRQQQKANNQGNAGHVIHSPAESKGRKAEWIYQ